MRTSNPLGVEEEEEKEADIQTQRITDDGGISNIKEEDEFLDENFLIEKHPVGEEQKSDSAIMYYFSLEDKVSQESLDL